MEHSRRLIGGIAINNNGTYEDGTYIDVLDKLVKNCEVHHDMQIVVDSMRQTMLEIAKVNESHKKKRRRQLLELLRKFSIFEIEELMPEMPIVGVTPSRDLTGDTDFHFPASSNPNMNSPRQTARSGGRRRSGATLPTPPAHQLHRQQQQNQSLRPHRN